LFKVADAYRLRKNEARDTPLPPETPAGKNPPPGAIINYSLKSAPKLVTLEILDAKGQVIRKYSSADERRKPDDTQAFPTYWFNPPFPLSKRVGLNRFVWDLRHERPLATRYGYSIAAAYGEDAIMQPDGPLVLPGNYTVKLTVDGQNFTTPLIVKLDPRVKASAPALERQHALALDIAASLKQSFDVVTEAKDLRAQLKDLQTKLTAPDARGSLEAVNKLDQQLAELVAVETTYPPKGIISAATLNSSLSSLLTLVESADTSPTGQATNAFTHFQSLLDGKLAVWKNLQTKDIPALNVLLAERQLPILKIKN
jgi:hypothetical protein